MSVMKQSKMAPRSLRVLPVVLVAAAACGGIESRRFEFDVIDTDNLPRPCLVVINNDFPGAEQKNQVVNVDSDDVLTLDLEFPAREVVVTVAPLRVVNNKVTKYPRSSRESWDTGYSDETRTVRIDDPTRVLFILPRRAQN